MSSLPTLNPPWFASDEDLIVHAGGDYATLAPPWQQLAYGVDGTFAANAPWVLASGSVDFQAQGVGANNVVWLTAPKTQYPGGGHFLAVDSSSGNSITLRRPYKDLNIGQPPAPISGLGAVTFNVLTFGPQLAEASYDLKQRFSIDDLTGNLYHSSKYIYDLQVLRVATVYSVLVSRYSQEARTERGDFADKIRRFRQLLDDAIARIQIRWGNPGVTNLEEPISLFSCRLTRG
jgi:hypothetical protein